MEDTKKAWKDGSASTSVLLFLPYYLIYYYVCIGDHSKIPRLFLHHNHWQNHAKINAVKSSILVSNMAAQT